MIGPADLSRTPPFTGSPCARRSEHSFPRRSPRVPHCPAIPLHGRTTRSSSASNCSHRTTTPRPACRTAPPRPRSYCVPPSPAHPCTGSRCAGRCEHTSPSNPRVPHRPAIPLRAQPPAHAGLPAVLAVRRLLGLPVVRPPRASAPPRYCVQPSRVPRAPDDAVPAGCEHSFPSDPSVAMPVLRIPRGCCVPTAALPSALDRAVPAGASTAPSNPPCATLPCDPAPCPSHLLVQGLQLPSPYDVS